VFNDEDKLIQRMAPMLRKVLIVDPQPASAKLLAELLRNMSRGGQHWQAPSTRKALSAVAQVEPQLIFVELSSGDVDGLEFTRKLRRSDLPSRTAPVIMVTATATAAAILAARDAGVHEFLRKPYTAKDLLRRLEAVIVRPRDWIEAVSYIGPDRRRFNSGDYSGPLKRRSDAKSTPHTDRMLRALRILKSAVAAVESDPAQALRAMRAQAAELQTIASIAAELSAATARLQRYLEDVVDSGAFDPSEAARHIAPLLEFLPRDETERGRVDAA
jgi:two-component system, response regulator PdtaR